MRTLVMVVVTAITFNLFAIIDGVKFCQNIDLGGLCSETTSTIFDLNGTYWYYWNGWYLVPVSRNDAISSIQVASDWEAYVCTDNNNNGYCQRFTAGTYNMTNYSLNDVISSITVQPATFEKAKSFYNGGEYGETNITGFAYLYQHPNYDISHPTYERLFLKKGDSVSDFSNYILKNNEATSIELYGSITATACKGTNFSGTCKNIKSTYYHLGARYDSWSWTDIGMQDEIESISLNNKPSIGWWQASDIPKPGWMQETALNLGSDGMTARVEYWDSDDPTLTYNGNMDDWTYYSRLTNRSNEPRFRQYGDNYDLLFVMAHGSFYTSPNYAYISTTPSNHGIYAGNDGNYWTNKIGAFNTDWFFTGACQSAGNGQAETVVIEAWHEVLERVHAFGGMLENATWWDADYYDSGDFRDNIIAGNRIGTAWIDSFLHTDISGYHRWPRYYTQESCDCELSSCTTQYQYDDFYGYGPQLADKGDPANYDWYCRRSHVDYHSTPRTMLILNQSFNNGGGVYVTEYAAKPFDRQGIIAKLGFSASDVVESEEPGAEQYKNQQQTITTADHRIFFSSLREIEALGHADSDEEAPELYKPLYEKEAWDIASSIYTGILVLDTVTADISTAYSKTQVALGIESQGGLVNRIQYIFVPIIDGRKVINDSIAISFDAAGLYTIRAKTSKTYQETGKRYEVSADRVAQLIVQSFEGKVDLSEAEKIAQTSEIYYVRDAVGMLRPALFIQKDKDISYIATVFLDE